MKEKIKNFFVVLKKYFIKISSLFFISILIICVLIYTFNYYTFPQFASKYVNSQEVNSLFEISNNNYLVINENAYSHFENNCIGNSASFLVQYGEVYKNKNIECKFIEGQGLIWTDGEKQSILSKSSASYINVLGNKVYFRNNDDYKFYSYDLSENKLKCLIQDKVGQTIVSSKGISYINLKDRKLKFKNFNEDIIENISDEQIIKFYVIGNKYLCLKKNMHLGFIENKKFKFIEKDVEQFLYNGNLVIQKGNNVYKYNTIRNVEIIKLPSSSRLLSIYKDYIIYIDYSSERNNVISVYNLETDQTNVLQNISKNQIVKGFYMYKLNDYIITLENTND